VTEPASGSAVEGTHAADAARILMIAATPYFADRGCHVRIQGETRALERLGHHVTIATYGLGSDVDGGRIVRGPGLPGYSRLDAAPARGKLLLDLGLLWSALGVARRDRPDVIHGHTQEGGLIALVLGRVLGLPVVVDLQSRRVAEELVAHGRAADGPLFRLADWFDRRIPRRADAVVTATETTARFVAEEAAPDGPLEVVADAIETPETVPTRDPELARRYGLDPDRPIVVYLGLLTTDQGVDLLIDAAAHLRAARDDVQWLLLGYPDVERWRARASERGVADRVTLPGRVPFVAATHHVGLGDVAVSAKRAGLQGNAKLLLYMACARPTVALDTPVNRAILGPDGWYADDDVEHFARTVGRALDQPDEARSRGARLRERAQRHDSWDARAAQLEAIYACLRGTRRSPP